LNRGLAAGSAAALYADPLDTGSNVGLWRTTTHSQNTPITPLYSNLIGTVDWNQDGRAGLMVPVELESAICVDPFRDENDTPTIYCPAHPNLRDWPAPNQCTGTQFALPPDSDGADRGLEEDPQFCETYAGGKGDIDESVYQMSVLDFVRDGNGVYRIRETPYSVTGLLANRHTIADDLYGDGVTDFIGRVGCVEQPERDDGAVGGGENDTRCFGFGIGGAWPLEPFVVNRELLLSERSYYAASLKSEIKRHEVLDLLEIVQDGFGRTHAWDYAPLSTSAQQPAGSPSDRPVDFPLYSIPPRDAGDSLFAEAPDDHFYFRSSMYVVSAFHRENGVSASGGLNTTYYGYEEAVFNRRGRGFQGFRRMIEETNTPGDTANDLRTVTDFHQVFPLAGRMKSRRVFQASDALTSGSPIQQIEEDWVCRRLTVFGRYIGECDALRDDQRGNAEVVLVRMDSMTSIQNDLETRNEVSRNAVSIVYNAINGQPARHTTSATDAGIRTRSIVTDFVYAGPQFGFDDWWIDRLRSRQETRQISYPGGHAVPGGLTVDVADVTGAQTVTELFGWNTTHRKPACVYRIAGAASVSAASNQCTLTPSQSQSHQFTHMAYDGRGNPVQERAMASDQQSGERVTDIRYTGDGYFVDQTTNPVGQTTRMVTDPRQGNVTRLTDIAGQTVRMAYDVFGREVETWFPVNAGNDSLMPTPGSHYAPRSSTRYQWASGCPGTNCSNNGKVCTVSNITDGSPIVVETFDRLNRVVARKTNGLDRPIHEVMTYTARGQVKSASEPGFAENPSTRLLTEFTYDPLGRQIKK
ncbi:MAG: hypothetical protein WDZ60_08540, partial [Wenzhouxiangellaceae bacterium]